jgi:hypothetical protein
MFSLLHYFRSRWAHDRQIRQSRRKHGHHRQQHRESIARFGHARQPGRIRATETRSFTGVRQGQNDGQGRLEREVDRKDGLLQGGELRPGQGPKSHDASNERLEDLGPEKGSIAYK